MFYAVAVDWIMPNDSLCLSFAFTIARAGLSRLQKQMQLLSGLIKHMKHRVNLHVSFLDGGSQLRLAGLRFFLNKTHSKIKRRCICAPRPTVLMRSYINVSEIRHYFTINSVPIFFGHFCRYIAVT